jgi:catechol 2,3-dioxygenase
MSIDAVPPRDASRIASSTTVGAVTLTVSDLARARDFYERVLGLVVLDPAGDGTPDGAVALGASNRRRLVGLREDRLATARDPRAPGLFHLALLLPTRRDLADALLRLAHSRWPLSGASDHLVSEALYLNDPDGNGIELYRDRPRSQWPHDPSGALQMDTLALDLHDLLAETGEPGAPPAHVAADTAMGHVHLQVSDVAVAEAFYHGVLGFDVTVSAYPGALFVSAGGYHHHLGLNTWNSRGAAPAGPGSVGLSRYEILVPDGDELERLRRRLHEAGVATDATAGSGDALLVADPFANAILLRGA